ncbi:hypothetical protein ACOSP7_021698 [Xanthoceras sorbifolium]
MTDADAFHSFYNKLYNIRDVQVCIDTAEDFFKKQNIDMAIFSILTAYNIKPPDANNEYALYFKAYMVHKLAFRAKNWYAVLGIENICVGIEEIEKQYKRLASILDPHVSPSVAAESAFRLINIAWKILSDPARREEYDQQLVTSNDFLDYASASSYSYSDSYITPKLRRTNSI